ncbi:MAG: hypothetical protein V4510_03300 [bacterium]
MASTRRTQPSPIPGAELSRLKEQLAPQYGSEVWDHEGSRVLVVRVPRDEPDVVNDLEQAVEYLSPSDVAGTPSCLLVGHQKAHMVPAQLLQDLMATRQQYDQRQCAVLRPNVKPGQHRTYRAPDDPHKLPRMAYRVPRPTVAELDDADIAALVREVGPRARESPYAEVRIVYLIADKDEVRIEGDLFFQDLHGRWVEQEERRRLAIEVEAKENAQKAQRDAERQALAAAMEVRRREVTAPMKRPAPGSWEADLPPARSRPSAASATPIADKARADMYAQLDALWPQTAQRAPRAAPQAPPRPPVEPVQSRPAPPPPAPAPKAPSLLELLRDRLTHLKFDVLLQPPVAGIELAAERGEGYPQRVIAFAPDRLDAATAERILVAARDVDADMALVVCPVADADAKRMFIATKARLVEPGEIATLDL